MLAKHIPHMLAQHYISKAPDRGTVRRSPGAFGLIPGGDRALISAIGLKLITKDVAIDARQ